MEKLTIEQAFKVMVIFLEDYYKRTHSDEIGILLGDLQLMEDGNPGDPASWSDWLISARKILGLDKSSVL
jgi:hypothetical protein